MYLSRDSCRFLAELRYYLDGLDATEAAKEYARDEMEPGPASLDLLARMGRDGWTGISWPVVYGGQGRTAIEQWLYLEELARRGIYSGGLTMTAIGPTLIERGTDSQRTQLLPGILTGAVRCAVGYTEADAGSDLGALRTVARRLGDHYVVRGRKLYTTMAQLATHLWLAVRTGRLQERSHGVSVLLIDLPQPGITIRPLYTQAGTRTNEVILDDVAVPVNNLVGQEGAGWEIIRMALDFERMLPVGGIGADFARFFGHRLDRACALAIDMELAMLFSRNVAVGEAGATRRVAAAMNKVWSTELRCSVASAALGDVGESGQLTGINDGAPLDGRGEHLFRVATMRRFAAGTNDIQLDIIARDALGLNGPGAVPTIVPTWDDEFVAHVRRWLEARADDGVLRQLGTSSEIDRELWQEMADLGWSAAAVTAPPAGGAQISAGVLAEIGRRGLPSPFAQLAGAAIVLAGLEQPNGFGYLGSFDVYSGVEDLIGELREVIASGQVVAPVAAHRLEDLPVVVWRGGRVELTGGPVYAEWASEARWLLVLAREDIKGTVMLLAIPHDAPNLVRVAVEVMDAQRVSAVYFRGVTSHRAQVLAEGPRSYATAVLAAIDVMRGAESVGTTMQILAMTCAHVRDRHQFGRPLASFQSVRHRCARMLMATTGAQLAVGEAMAGIDRGCGSLLQMTIGVRSATRSLEEVAMEGSLLHGGTGFMAEHPLARMFCRAGAVVTRTGCRSNGDEDLVTAMTEARRFEDWSNGVTAFPWLAAPIASIQNKDDIARSEHTVSNSGNGATPTPSQIVPKHLT